jgi:hypothetical protein
MVFVPPVQTIASATALDLGQRIVNLVQEYRQTHPGTSADDVREALRLATLNTPAGGRRRARVAVLVAAAAVAALVPVLLQTHRGRVPFPISLPVVVMVVVLMVILMTGLRR